MQTKICYIITKGVWGGAQKYVYTLATSLSKERFEPIVICGDGDALPKKLEEAGVKTYHLPHLARDISLVAEIKSSWNILKIVWREKPDVLHLSSPKAGGFGAVAGRLCGVRKIIYTAHGFAFNEDRSALSKSLIWFFSWLTIMLCQKTIVIAEKEKRQALEMLFVSPRKIIFIPNGIEKTDFKERSEARKYLLSRIGKISVGNGPWFGTIAELHKNKGLEYAISALSKITFPFVYFIIGEGEERKNLQNLIAKHGLQDKVFLLGFVEKGSQYLKAFDIFILTSVKEGLPYTILEAGLAGLPVVASSVGGIPDVIENGKEGILVESGNPDQIASAMEDLVNNETKRKVLGQNLKKRVEGDFSVQKMLEKTCALYKTHI